MATAAKAKSTAIVKAPPPAPVPVDLSGYSEYAGDGFQNQTRDDIAIPFLDILHYTGPLLDKLAPSGAKPGMIINKATNRLYDGQKGILFVPCLTQHQYLEWVPVNKGGGLVSVYPLDAPVVAEARAAKRFGKHELKNGNELAETFYAYGVLVGEDGDPHTPAVIGFSSTRIKAYQQWMAHARSQVGRTADGQQFAMPLYAYCWRLTSDPQSKNNNKWFTWHAQFYEGSAAKALLPPTSEVFQLAQATTRSINVGALKTDHSQARHDGASDAEAGEGGGPAAPQTSQGDAKKAPF